MKTIVDLGFKRIAGCLAGAGMALLLTGGCASSSSSHRQSEVYKVGLLSRTPRMKSVVAVMAFDNKSGFSGQWNLGEGVADLVNAELLESSRVIVLERQHLNDVVDELNMQNSEMFRPEGRAAWGRLKNAEYLIRGTISDFTVIGDASGWFSYNNVKAGARGSKARVAVAIRVYDVANGEVISTVKSDATASGRGFGGAVNYQQVAFGGDAYFQTPLGRATETAIERAVKDLLNDLPIRNWQPRVAEVTANRIYVNGGQNVSLKPGLKFLVREDAKPITDPGTGNVIDFLPGKIIGRLEITAVSESTSQASLTEGTANRGDYLEAVK